MSNPVAPSPAAALFAFAGWLTGRREVTTLSARHDAGPAAVLVQRFCESQGYAEPQDGWDKALLPYPDDPITVAQPSSETLTEMEARLATPGPRIPILPREQLRRAFNALRLEVAGEIVEDIQRKADAAFAPLLSRVSELKADLAWQITTGKNAVERTRRAWENERARLDAALASRSEDSETLDWLATQTIGDTTICPPGNHGGNALRWLLTIEPQGSFAPDACVEYEALTLREVLNAARRSPPAPIYAHVCGIPDKNGDQQQCEACEHDARRSPSEDTK